ncbi:unnamed protein product [Cladocopium goreaui]|uniref:Uncharacterized protein n=1 Tax=Cladocopium goreaui TaxID=2562237 RepID=A0A9P1CVC0_9DINO|nr:unnamed protein product [Cladocopium goreaui]
MRCRKQSIGFYCVGREPAAQDQARWESQKLKHILEIQEQQFGKEDRDTLNTKIDLAAALQLQNDFTGAQKQLEEVFEALGRAQSADLKPQLEEVSEALGRAGPTDLKDDPITRRAVDCFASLLGCLHEDKETMLKEVSKMQSQKLGEEHPLTVNSKADLAVVLQERDEQKEAAQVLKEILQEPHGHDVGIDFLKDLTLSPGPAAAAKDSAIDDKKKFTLHFVAKERAHANTEETSDIKYEGKIRSGASACWISFPGKFAAGWDALVAELHGDSVACVFLSTPDSGLGWHHKFADGSCYCKHIYGERDFETFGYLVKMKDRDSEKLKREQAKAKLTHAVVVAADATDKEEEKCRQEAERRWKENGKTAAWGCQWFHAWKEKVQSSGKT